MSTHRRNLAIAECLNDAVDLQLSVDVAVSKLWVRGLVDPGGSHDEDLFVLHEG